ncbi:hypothetical protein PoB_004476900 [Plakobranchus ocellatus]|uniref:Uncharacterized protein n=1 Tax=Plakobranchus ocellatus TaxID=259542 RepID=A0AAV4BHE0_9GAST|nr:hypothetical protein PoB_004476900 [Plakobranchus ocellatus]
MNQVSSSYRIPDKGKASFSLKVERYGGTNDLRSNNFTVEIFAKKNSPSFSKAQIILSSSGTCGVGYLAYDSLHYNLKEPPSANCSTVLTTKQSGSLRKSHPLYWSSPFCGCVRIRAVVMESPLDKDGVSTGYTQNFCVVTKSRSPDTDRKKALCDVLNRYSTQEIISTPLFLERHNLKWKGLNKTAVEVEIDARRKRLKNCCEQGSFPSNNDCFAQERHLRIRELCRQKNSSPRPLPFTLLRRKNMEEALQACCSKPKEEDIFECFKRNPDDIHKYASALEFSLDETDPLNDLADYVMIQEDVEVWDSLTKVMQTQFPTVAAKAPGVAEGSPKDGINDLDISKAGTVFMQSLPNGETLVATGHTPEAAKSLMDSLQSRVTTLSRTQLHRIEVVSQPSPCDMQFGFTENLRRVKSSGNRLEIKRLNPNLKKNTDKKLYQVKIKAPADSHDRFKQVFLAVTEHDECGMGHFTYSREHYQIEKETDSCPLVISSKSNGKMSELPKLTWTSPICGCVNFRALIVIDNSMKYEMDDLGDINGDLSARVCVRHKTFLWSTMSSLCHGRRRYKARMFPSLMFMENHGLQHGMLNITNLKKTLHERADMLDSVCKTLTRSIVEKKFLEWKKRLQDKFCSKTFPDIPFTVKNREKMWDRHKGCCSKKAGPDRYACFKKDLDVPCEDLWVLKVSHDELDPVNFFTEFFSYREDIQHWNKLTNLTVRAEDKDEICKKNRDMVTLQQLSMNKALPVGAGSRSRVSFSKKCVYHDLKQLNLSKQATRTNSEFTLNLRSKSSSSKQRNYSVEISSKSASLEFVQAQIAVISSSPCGPGKLEFLKTDYNYTVAEPLGMKCSNILLTTNFEKKKKVPELTWYPPLCGCVQFRALLIENGTNYERDLYADINGSLTKTMCISLKSDVTAYIEALCSVLDRHYPPEIVSSRSYLKRYASDLYPPNLMEHHTKLLDNKKLIKDCCEKGKMSDKVQCFKQLQTKRVDEYCENRTPPTVFTQLRRAHMNHMIKECCVKTGPVRYSCMQKRNEISHLHTKATAFDFSLDETDVVNDISNYVKIEKDFDIFNMITQLEKKTVMESTISNTLKSNKVTEIVKIFEARSDIQTAYIAVSESNRSHNDIAKLETSPQWDCELDCSDQTCSKYKQRVRSKWCNTKCLRRRRGKTKCQLSCEKTPVIETITHLCNRWKYIYGQCEKKGESKMQKEWCAENCNQGEDKQQNISKQFAYKKCCVAGVQYSAKLMSQQKSTRAALGQCLINRKGLRTQIKMRMNSTMREDCLTEFQSCCILQTKIPTKKSWKSKKGRSKNRSPFG